MLSKSRIFLYINLVLFLFLASKNLYLKERNISEQEYINKWLNKKIILHGLVCQEAKLDYRSRRLTICGQSKVLVTTELYPEYNYGDYVQLVGTLQAVPQFDTFDYAAYLSRQDIYALMYYPKITLSSGHLRLEQKAYLLLLKFKWRLKNILERSLPDPESNLALALILGYKNLLHPLDTEAFTRAGLSHLIAISGAHIGIITILLINFLENLSWPRKRTYRLLIIFLSIYPILTGFSASALRASLMGILMLIALYHGRLFSIYRALIFSANIMLFIEPKLLLDLGFQLSFAAVLGIIYSQPILTYSRYKLARYNHKVGGKIMINFFDAFSLTTICQLAIFPILAVNFHMISLVSWLANPVVLWMFPSLLACLLVPIIPIIIFPGLGLYLLFPAYILLKFLFLSVYYFAAWPRATLVIGNFSWPLIVIYYIILILIIRYLNSKVRKSIIKTPPER